MIDIASRVLTLFIVLLTGGIASGDIRRVPQDYPTIAAAFTAAVNGDEILVAPGTYVGPFTFPAKNITLRSSGGAEVTTLQGSGSAGPVLAMQAGTTLNSIVEGFTITGGTGGYGGGIFIANGGGATVRKNIIRNNTASNEGAGLFSYPSNPITIDNCIFESNSMSGIGRAGACTGLGTTSTVRNCVFSNNSSNSGGAIYAIVSQTTTLTNCTFYGNSAPNGSAIDGDGQVVLQNCIFWNHQGNPIRSHSGGSAMATFSCIQNGTGQPWFGTGCIAADPLLISPSTGNFKLQQNSPAINAGNPAAAFNDPDGSRNDMGYTGGPGSNLTRWQRAADIPHPRAGHALAASGNSIYVIAGATDAGLTKTVQRYDTGANTWTLLPDLPGNAIRSAAACQLNGYIYLVGGYLYDYAISDQLLRFDPQSGIWTTCTKLPEARLHASVHELNGKLYVLGGRTWQGGWQYRNTALVYDPSLEGSPSSPWSQETSAAFSSVLGDNAGVTIKGDLFTFGSYEPAQHARFATYSPRFRSWRLLPSTPMTTSPNAVRMGDAAYLFDSGNGNFWKWSYTASAGVQRGVLATQPLELTFDALDRPPVQQNGPLVAHGSRIYLISGKIGSSTTANVYFYQ